MTKRKKRTIIVVAVILALLALLPLTKYLVGEYYFTPAKYYEENWGIQLPKRLKELYQIDNIGFPSDGVEYCIYELKQDEDATAYFQDYETEKSSSFETAVKDDIKSLDIPDEWQPDFEQPYQWKIFSRENTRDRVYVYYISSNRRVVVTRWLQ